MSRTRKRTSNGHAFVVDEWHSLYRRRWETLITPEATAHPARFGFGLIDHIYRHTIDMGWLARGDTVLDPFAGVACGALCAITRGVHWRGIELEPHNVLAANGLLDHWRYTYRTMNLASAEIIRGDSVQLKTLWPNLRPRVAVSSPPFLQQSGGTNVTAKHGPLSDPALIKRHAAGNAATKAYGRSVGQVQAMPEGDLRLILSSPPYSEMMASKHVGDSGRRKTAERFKRKGFTTKRADVFTSPTNHGAAAMFRGNYGGKSPSQGQLGSMPLDTFWSTCAAIVSQVFDVLPSGGHCVWVCKDYIRNKQRVPFSDNWRKLCEHHGLITLHEHHAMLVEEYGSQATIEGPAIAQRKDRKSMFKRWQEAKGQTPVDWETVWCMVKP